jgi:hypothetical protein
MRMNVWMETSRATFLSGPLGTRGVVWKHYLSEYNRISLTGNEVMWPEREAEHPSESKAVV